MEDVKNKVNDNLLLLGVIILLLKVYYEYWRVIHFSTLSIVQESFVEVVVSDFLC